MSHMSMKRSRRNNSQRHNENSKRSAKVATLLLVSLLSQPTELVPASSQLLNAYGLKNTSRVTYYSTSVDGQKAVFRVNKDGPSYTNDVLCSIIDLEPSSAALVLRSLEDRKLNYLVPRAFPMIVNESLLYGKAYMNKKLAFVPLKEYRIIKSMTPVRSVKSRSDKKDKKN